MSAQSNAPELKFIVQSRPRICALIERVIDRHPHVALRPVQKVAHCQSRLLGIDSDGGKLYFGEADTAAGHEAVRETGKLRVHAQLDGVDLKFITELDDLVPDWKGQRAYRSHLPDYVLFFQKRETHRTPLLDEAIEIRGFAPDGSLFAGYLLDASIDGLSFVLETALPLSVGDRLREARYHLPFGEVLQCGLEIRSLEGAEAGQRIGCEFVQLDEQRRSHLGEVLARITRHQLLGTTD
jgi:c-di-GMP-binding flagellar brake protein YcgR